MSGWQACLIGVNGEVGRGVVQEVADELVDLCSEHGHEIRQPRYGALSVGYSGIALLHAHVGDLLADERHEEAALACLNRALDRIDELPEVRGLFAGVAGIGWVVEHLTNMGLVPSDDEVGEALAHVIHRTVDRADPGCRFDLLGGLTGFGVYALERRDRPLGAEILDLVVELLGASAISRNGGIVWGESLDRSGQSPAQGDAELNLGMAAGIPGVIGFLASVVKATSDPRARTLLTESVRWLRKQRMPDGSVAAYPYTISESDRPTGRQVAWCYGDLSIAIALLGAARALDDAEIETEAVDLARSVASRPLESVKVVDNGLCHGRAGVAHLFNRIAQAVHDPVLLASAVTWYERILRDRQPGSGVGGFRVFDFGKKREGDPWRSDAGFQSGSAGTILALLAAVSGRTPNWDRVLLTDV